MSDNILVSRDGFVGTITINRPEKLNAMTPEMATSAGGLSAMDKELGKITLQPNISKKEKKEHQIENPDTSIHPCRFSMPTVHTRRLVPYAYHFHSSHYV